MEVKRSTDMRIRREVVGQMLDYAANALSYWRVETIRGHFEAATSEWAFMHLTGNLAKLYKHQRAQNTTTA